MGGNSLTGKLLHDDEETEKYVLSSTSNLKVLSLFGNKFSDGMLLSILCLKGLEFLDLSYNDLSMEIPTEIGNYLPNISTLALTNNRLTGGIPSSMRRLIFCTTTCLQERFRLGCSISRA